MNVHVQRMSETPITLEVGVVFSDNFRPYGPAHKRITVSMAKDLIAKLQAAVDEAEKLVEIPEITEETYKAVKARLKAEGLI